MLRSGPVGHIPMVDDMFQTSGATLLDGKELAEYETGLLRTNIGLALQKNHIFNGTIEENICYGRIEA